MVDRIRWFCSSKETIKEEKFNVESMVPIIVQNKDRGNQVSAFDSSILRYQIEIDAKRDIVVMPHGSLSKSQTKNRSRILSYFTYDDA